MVKICRPICSCFPIVVYMSWLKREIATLYVIVLRGAFDDLSDDNLAAGKARIMPDKSSPRRKRGWRQEWRQLVLWVPIEFNARWVGAKTVRMWGRRGREVLKCAANVKRNNDKDNRENGEWSNGNFKNQNTPKLALPFIAAKQKKHI